MPSTAPDDDVSAHAPVGFLAFRRPARLSTTLEVRWIRRGPVPQAMIQWLGPFDDWIEQREDRYLVDPSGPDLGLKIKDGLIFDVKAFRGSAGKLTVPAAGRGRVELWEKWSFVLHGDAVPPADAEGWLALQKTRRRRSFEVGEHGVSERPVQQADLPGCSVELTEVAIGQEVWWTFGFEANGDRETLELNLHATAARLLRSPSDESGLLDLRHSISYAGWLHRRWSVASHGARVV